MIRIVNLTNHDIDILFCPSIKNGNCKKSDYSIGCRECKHGKVRTIEPKKFSMSATPVQKVIREDNWVKYCTLNWKGKKECEEELQRLEEEHDDAIFVGSIIAAQAFPERVCAMVPVPGYERVARDKKLVRSDMFTIFEKGD